MKKCLLASLLLVVLPALAFASGKSEVQAATKPASSIEADKAAIEEVWVSYPKYVVEGDLDGFLALHDRDAYKMPQDQPMFQPWAIADTLRSSWAKRLATFTMQMSANPKEIVVMGDYAYTMGTYRQVTIPKAGGKQTVFDGKFLTVLHKDTDGKWKILRDCYNSNTPPGS